jgi:RNA polymerase sigma factor (sigma-70 family)
MRSDVVAVSREIVPAALLRQASDERLVAYVRVGSERAFEAIFERHHRAVLAFCRHMLGSSADAEDAVQHTFLAAYRDLLRSDKPIVLRPWLYTIARHRCVSMLRERRARPAAELLEPTSDQLSVELVAREELRTTLTDIARLPEDQRTALILAELSDVSYEEIARILGCRHGKVKALVFQARSSLSADREARETPCADIREQLSTRGGALRQTTMRRHVRECDGCRRFRDEIRMRRRHLRVFLPLVPWLGFKRAFVGAMSGWGGAGVGAAGMTAGALGGGGFAVALVVTAAASGGTVSTAAGEHRASSMRQVPATTTTMQEKVTGAVERSPRTQRVAAVWRGDRLAARVRETTGSEVAPVVPHGEHRAPAPTAGVETRPSTADPPEIPSVPEQVKELPAERHRAAPHKPTPQPVANGQGRPGAPAGSNGHPKPAQPTHPEPARQPTPAPAKGPGKPPSAPSPAPPSPPSLATPAAPAVAAPAAPEPSPPANSNAGGSGNRSDEVNGHRGERPRH